MGRVASCFCKKRPNVKLRMSEGQVVTAQGLPNVGDWRGNEREGKRRKRERLLMFRVTDANLACCWLLRDSGGGCKGTKCIEVVLKLNIDD